MCQGLRRNSSGLGFATPPFTMPKLKVAMVAPSLRILGGQAVQADRLLRAWQNDPDVEAWLVPVNPALPRPLRFTGRIKYLRTLINEVAYLRLLVRELPRADVVHVFSASYSSFLLAPLPAILLARAFGRPVLLNYRSGEAPDHLRGSAIARKTVRGVTLSVVPSRFLADVFETVGLRSTIIPNIVDTGSFRYRERRPLRPRLLTTRNFEALYNVACTLRAFRLVQDRWPEATLTLVGKGAEELALRSLARQLSLRGVTFAGPVAPDRIAAFYADHDIYVQTPDIDNMPTSVLEAYASGLPVVSTEAGGIPAILTHGEHGLLAPLNDHRAIAARVLSLLDDPDEAAAMAGRARTTCDARTWSAVRDQWLRAYRTCAGQTTAQTATRSPAMQPVTRRQSSRADGRDAA
jgi:glycosyltransferase involved in cell wall biosynthesis